MKSKPYHKLVRDLIPAIIQKNGGTPAVKKLNAREYSRALREKLLEEVAELFRATDKKATAEEIADVVEVLEAIACEKKISWLVIQKKKTEKRRTRGGFTKKIFLTHVKE